MDRVLQLIIIVITLFFTFFIIRMVNKRKLQLKYTLTWILTSFIFLLIAVFPSILSSVSNMLHIVEPVNALFTILIFFLLLIIFSLTKAISNYSNKVKDLTQEVGILKNYLENNHINK